MYGDVFRVKIMFNKKDTALVQFADPGQAHIGELTPRLLLYVFVCVIPLFFCNVKCIACVKFTAASKLVN